MLAGCSESEELAQRLSESSQEGRIDFTVYASRNTRAGQPGLMDLDALKADGAGFGVFAYHTDNSFYDEARSEANFMYNQPVKWTAGAWAYDPVKYWPNEFGTNAASRGTDYVSFFAYAPFVDFDPVTGAAPADRWKNITSASRDNDLGDPLVRYIVDTNPQTSVDLLWGVAAEAFNGLAPGDPAAPLTEGACLLNLTKQVGTGDAIKWRFHHALAKLNVQIVAAADVPTADYTPGATANPDVDQFTRVYLRWIEFNGFAMNGALNLHSGTPLTDGPKPYWRSFDGAGDLKATTVRFNDGLIDGDEGLTNNRDPNERVLGALNPAIIESPTTAAGWTSADKTPGITASAYVNLFEGADDAASSVYVIPTGQQVRVKMLYDIETADPKLGKYLSDGKTTGLRIANEINKTIDGLKFEAGKAYTLKIVVGLESVKVTAEIADWGEEYNKEVFLPGNEVPTQSTIGPFADYDMEDEGTF